MKQLTEVVVRDYVTSPPKKLRCMQENLTRYILPDKKKRPKEDASVVLEPAISFN